MALVARGVEGGSDINVLVDNGATGDMQVMKLAYSTAGNETLIGADANGLDVDVTRMVPGTGATALGKAEDDPAASGDVGVMALVVRRDTAVADAAAGDYQPPHVDAVGSLWVAGSQIEDAVAASGDRGLFVLGVRRDTPTAGAAAGDYHEFEVDATGNLWVAGAQIEDAVAASGDRGHFVLAVRRDVPTSSAAAGDYHEVQVDALGRLWVTGTQAEDAVAGSGDTGQFALAIRRDTPVADAANGDYTGMHVNALGYLRVIDVADETQPSNGTTAALDSDPVIKGSAGVLYGFQGYCAAAGFVQIHNKATAPTAGNVPVIVIPVAAGAAFSLDLGRRARAMSTGISVGFSSTGPTFTDGGNNMWIDVQYI